MQYYTRIENGIVVAYRTIAEHGEELCNELIENGGIVVDEELRQHCLSLGIVSFIGKVENRIYRIEDKVLFKVENIDRIIEKLNISKDELSKEIVHKTPMEIKMETLEEENLRQKEEMLIQAEFTMDLDFRMTNYELGL